jgi:hypothetical protein
MERQRRRICALPKPLRLAGAREPGRPTRDGWSGEEMAQRAVWRMNAGTAVGGVGFDVRDSVGFGDIEARIRPGSGARQRELQGRREEPAGTNDR